MPVKATIAPACLRADTYPKLKIQRSLQYIVLFTEPSVGTVVWATERSPNSLGTHSKRWDDSFDPWDGTLTLTNG